MPYDSSLCPVSLLLNTSPTASILGLPQKKALARRTKKRKRLKLGEIYLDSILPLDLVSLSAFAEHHGIPWSAVTKAMKDYELFPERGTWKDGWRTVKVAIDERGRATFYDLFHTHAKFKCCDECPHKWW